MHVVYARTHRRDPTEPRRQPIWWREPATGGGEGRGARNASFFFPFPFPPSPALSSSSLLILARCLVFFPSSRSPDLLYPPGKARGFGNLSAGPGRTACRLHRPFPFPPPVYIVHSNVHSRPCHGAVVYSRPRPPNLQHTHTHTNPDTSVHVHVHVHVHEHGGR